MAEIQDRETQLNLENQKKEALHVKIRTMESKLLCGGKNIVDHTNEQQRALEKRQQEIAEQKRLEREIMKQMEEKEETMLALQGNYSSLQEEVDIKTKKLKKLFQKLQLIKQEVSDVQVSAGGIPQPRSSELPCEYCSGLGRFVLNGGGGFAS